MNYFINIIKMSLFNIVYDVDLNCHILKHLSDCPKSFNNIIQINKKSNQMIKKSSGYHKYKIQSIKIIFMVMKQNYNYYKNRFQNLQTGIELALNQNYLIDSDLLNDSDFLSETTTEEDSEID